jgi:hypothetical protein
MDDMNQPASAGLTLVFTAVLLIAGQLYIGTKPRSHGYLIATLSSPASAAEKPSR